MMSNELKHKNKRDELHNLISGHMPDQLLQKRAVNYLVIFSLMRSQKKNAEGVKSRGVSTASCQQVYMQVCVVP